MLWEMRREKEKKVEVEVMVAEGLEGRGETDLRRGGHIGKC